MSSICLLASYVALIAFARAQINEEKAIEFAKHLDVSRLDSTLAHVSFSQWLTATCGDSSYFQWELNDCGEQTGYPAIDKNRDIPSCIGVDVTLPRHRKLSIMILVGTFKKGLMPNPVVSDIYLQTKGVFRSIKRLRDIPKELRQASE